MKRKSTKIILMILICLICIFIMRTIINNRIITNNINIPINDVFIPHGIADYYKDYSFYSFDDYRIWGYNLNDSENT